MQGVFDAEGSVLKTRNVISIGSKNKKLLSVCKELLKEMKINCGNICKSNGDIMKFCIYGKYNLRLFRDKIGFSHPNKLQKLNLLLSP